MGYGAEGVAAVRRETAAECQAICEGPKAALTPAAGHQTPGMALREQLRRPHGSQQLVPRCIHVRCAVNHKHKHRACRETAGELHVRRVATTTTLSTEQSWWVAHLPGVVICTLASQT